MYTSTSTFTGGVGCLSNRASETAKVYSEEGNLTDKPSSIMDNFIGRIRANNNEFESILFRLSAMKERLHPTDEKGSGNDTAGARSGYISNLEYECDRGFHLADRIFSVIIDLEKVI